MRVGDLDHKELLEIDAEGGVIRFAGRRALLLDAVAMGLLRKYLVESFASSRRAPCSPSSASRTGGARPSDARMLLVGHRRRPPPRRTAHHTLEGLFCTQPESETRSPGKGRCLLASYRGGAAPPPLRTLRLGGLLDHLRAHERAPSQTTGKEIYVLEDRCLGQGHGRVPHPRPHREEWGDEHAEELAFFDSQRLAECLDVSLSA